jgi:hypothetical protein
MGLVVVTVALAGGCAAPQPEPESVAVKEAEAAVAAAAATAAEQEAEREEHAAPSTAAERRRAGRREEDRSRRTLVVVDPGGAPKAKTPRELADASRRERELHGDRSVGEITDDNLAALAAQGKVTFTGGEAGEGGESIAGVGDGSAAAADDAEAAEDVCGEACWRRRVRELREGWSEAAAEIGDWEEEAAELRWRFYAEDDPWVRDGRIKPAWDRALDRIRRSRDEADRYRERLAETLEEGRRAGALPGWLRDGIALEPKPAEAAAEAGDAAEPVEPDVLEDDAVQPKRH